MRDKIAGYANDMLALGKNFQKLFLQQFQILIRNFHFISYEYIGVKGLRVDASKHMWPGDLEAIQVKL